MLPMVMLTETVKIRIYPTNTQIDMFTALQQQFVAACNFTSDYIFNHGFELGQVALHRALYHSIREHFNLPAQLAQSVMRTVIAKYKTVKTSLSQKPYVFKDDCDGQWYRIKKDLRWLDKPIYFNRAVAVLVRNRSYSKLADNIFSIGTLSGREKVEAALDYDYLAKFHDDSWTFGEAELLERHGQWYLYISATKEFSDFDESQIKHVVGIDRGLRQVLTTYDETGKTEFYSGRAIMKTRRKYKRLRQQLQSKQTDSAKRRLKKLNQKENRWMSDVNHCLSKALLDYYGPNTLFVLEDLTNVRFATEKHAKQTRYEAVSWSFYDFEEKLMYKALEQQSLVVKVDAHYTSQRCPGCGVIDKASRNHSQHLFTCVNCGYTSNDDRVGAMNIQELGRQWVSGVTNPRFERVMPKQIY